MQGFLEGLSQDAGKGAEVIFELSKGRIVSEVDEGDVSFFLSLTRTITQFPAAMPALNGAMTEYSKVCVQGSM